MRAKAAGIRLAATQLLALHEARRSWERRMAELLLGGPRTGRDRTVTDPDPGNAIPGGEIYLSMPGLGDRLAARVAGEIGWVVSPPVGGDAIRQGPPKADRPGHRARPTGVIR